MVMKNPDPASVFYRCLYAFVFMVLSAGLFSQEPVTCAQKLKNAQSSFEKGQVEQVPSLLKDCMRSGFKKEEALAAYKLLIQTFLLNDKIEMADSVMYEFLKKFPEYQISPTDHSSFVYLYKSFNVKPVIQVGVHTGMNLPFLSFVSQNLTAGKPGESVFSSNFGNLFLSFDSKFRIRNNLEVCFEIGYSQVKFSNRLINYLNFANISYIETQQRIEIPVSAVYDFVSFGRFKAYARAGIGAAYNLSVMATATSLAKDENNYSGNRPGETLERRDSRVAIDLFGQIGGGIKYKVPGGYFFTEIRSDFGFCEQNVPGGKVIPQLDFFYQWRDPDFRLNTLNFNVGFTYIFYKPSKRKE
jgi:hypothetical protein